MTIFAKIIAKELPADIVYEDGDVLAFKDIMPAAPFHVLVIPKQEVLSLDAMTEADMALMGKLMWTCKKVANEAGYKDYRVVANTGAGAGQTVFHLHFHVLAGRPMKWPPG